MDLSLNYPLLNIIVGYGNKLAKDEWLKKTLAAIPKGKRILDAGAGQLQYKDYCKHLRYTSQDFGQYDGIGSGEGLQKGLWDDSKIDIVSDITHIPVPDNSYDAVMCIEVLEHVPYPNQAITEFSRILKSGGYLILTAPFCSITHYAPYYFSNGFSKYWYQKMLIDNGFIIEELKLRGNYFEYIAQEIRRIPTVIKKYSRISFVWLPLLIPLIIVNLFFLQLASKSSKKSEELLCYGIMVRAKKRK